MKGPFLYIALILISRSALAAEGEYAISRIPAELKKNAHVVKRMEQVRFEMLNVGEAIYRRKYALTILDEKGNEAAVFIEYYDQFHEIRNVEGSLYDANGKELKRLKNKQVVDFSGMDDDLANDNRFKSHSFFHRSYPYTVEYEVEIRMKGTMFFPEWAPREKENFSVEQSSMSVVAPIGYQVRYKTYNYSSNPVESMEKDKKVLTWSISQLPAIETEYASPPWHEINPSVLFAPAEFAMEKYEGDLSTWEGLAKFQSQLNQGRDQLPESVKQAIHKIADPISEPAKKVEKLYEYLQQNTRYISIQLGIGGWQPFEAKYVAAKAYGDCKALTNYMYSMLKEVGIQSNYTLIYAGRGASKISPDFPSARFNHVILSVPLKEDTIWLECTSQTLPAGYLGQFTDNRYALSIGEDGGKLVRTPVYGLDVNKQVRNIKALLDAEAKLKIQSRSRYQALQQDIYHSMIHGLSKEKLKEYLNSELDFPTYDISDFNYKEFRQGIPVVEENLEIVVNNYATMTGKRLFIAPNVMTRTSRKLQTDVERKFDIYLGDAYHDIDSVEISLPAGYSAESMPQDINLSSPFGKYRASIKLDGNKLLYYRDFEFNGGRYPAKDYNDLVKFYESIYKADRNKVVLVKPEETLKGF